MRGANQFLTGLMSARKLNEVSPLAPLGRDLPGIARGVLSEMLMDNSTNLTVQGGLLRPNPDVVARRLDRAGVLVHLPTNRIFEFNETGIRIWELIADGRDPDSIVDRLVEEFDVDRTRASYELSDFITQFRREGLVE
jgi:hypothetical protein